MSSEKLKVDTSTTKIARGLLSRSGTPMTPGTRLPSLTPGRDLTLNGVNKLLKPKKPSFAPNLNFSRTTQKESTSTTSQTKVVKIDKNERKMEFSDRGRGRGRGRGAKNFIQTAGAFSEGVGASVTGAATTSGFGGRATSRLAKLSDDTGSSTSGTMTIPKLELNFFNCRVNEKDETEMMQQLLQDDFIDDLDKSDVIPVVLPLKSASPNVNVDEKKEVKPLIKAEGEEESMEVDGDDAKVKIERKDVKPIVAQTAKSLSDILKTEQKDDRLLFFQFTDCMPHMIPAQPSTSADTEPKETLLKFGNVSDLEEGEIGELQVLESGRMRVCLSGISYNVEEGLKLSFSQDLLSVRLNEGHQTGHLSVIGSIQNQLTCSLDADHLLSNLNR